MILVFSFLVSIKVGNSQSNYFQQKVDYTIDVSLNDEAHLLTGSAEITYQNNSPQALSEIYFHLWANAYQSKTSAFAKQKLRDRDVEFYFAKPEEMGGYEQIDFLANGKKLTWAYDKEYRDIAKIDLPTPLASGKSITLSIPFEVRVPNSYSRFGHVNTSYQMTQWYPKPAVYDQNGWHAMPYLDMGEFYSEFGNFDVTITIPKNYIVASTGALETESEKEFLNQKVNETYRQIENGFKKDLLFPASSTDTKTIRYTAENLHDFAWFADKRFHVVKDVATIGDGQTVDTWAFFTNEQAKMWTKGAFYAKRAVEHYSKHVGDYPWPHATAVQSALSAGAGMEYPMITVIGRAGNAKSLDRVITHEVGHNWFYGILANNERTDAWFDEGLNTYYENRYMLEYYKNDDEVDLPSFIKGGSKMGVNELGCLYHDRRHLDQAPKTHSNELVPLNYGLAAYAKPGRALRLLEKYVGTEAYDVAMKTYFDQWKFKHPQPEDFQKSLESSLGKNLDWLFEGLLYSIRKSDFSIKNVKEIAEGYAITVKNKGNLSTPFPIQGIKNGAIISEKWFDGVEKSTIINFPKGDYDKIVIDENHVTLDVQRKNNHIKTSGALPKMEPLEFAFLGGIENPAKSRINYLPALGFNDYDGAMIGMAFYSNPVPARKFEYYVAPMFGVNRQSLVGIGKIRYNKYFQKGAFHRIAFEVGAKSFGLDYSDTYDRFSEYFKIAPKIIFNFRKSKAVSNISQQLSFRTVFINQSRIKGIDAGANISQKINNEYYVNDLEYNFKNENILKPFNATANIHQGAGFIKTFANANQTFKFMKGKKRFQIKGFAGWMNQENKDKSLPPKVDYQINGVVSSSLAQRDYMFDELMFGRSSNNSFFNNQIFDRDANLRVNRIAGGSDDWMVGFGLQTGIPNPLPIEAYLDLAILPDGDSVTTMYSGGLAVIVLRDIFEVYFPIIQTKSLIDPSAPGFFQQMSFKLNLNKANPWYIINNFKL